MHHVFRGAVHGGKVALGTFTENASGKPGGQALLDFGPHVFLNISGSVEPRNTTTTPDHMKSPAPLLRAFEAMLGYHSQYAERLCSVVFRVDRVWRAG